LKKGGLVMREGFGTEKRNNISMPRERRRKEMKKLNLGTWGKKNTITALHFRVKVVSS